MNADAGFEVAFHGEYKEVVPNEKIVSTEIFEGAPGDGTVNTVTFTESAGRTTVELLIDAPSKDVRDMIISTGMEDGLQDALDLLEEVSTSLT
jgi:uncharacterized protein YndB with AHSA1/START domain